jgi:hypothetical protein
MQMYNTANNFQTCSAPSLHPSKVISQPIALGEFQSHLWHILCELIQFIPLVSKRGRKVWATLLQLARTFPSVFELLFYCDCCSIDADVRLRRRATIYFGETRSLGCTEGAVVEIVQRSELRQCLAGCYKCGQRCRCQCCCGVLRRSLSLSLSLRLRLSLSLSLNLRLSLRLSLHLHCNTRSPALIFTDMLLPLPYQPLKVPLICT